MNIYSCLYHADRANNLIFELTDGQSLLYKDIDHKSAKVANWISKQGWNIGSRIVSQIPKSIEAVSFYLGTVRAGMVYVPISSMYTSAEVIRLIDDCCPVAVITEKDSVCWNEESINFETVSVSNNSPATIIYTSGTTGPSRGAVISHSNLIENMLAFDTILNLEESDRLIHCLPIFHAHGLIIALHAQMYKGASSYWLDKFDADICIKLLPTTSIMMAVPTIYHRLATHPLLNNNTCKNVKAFISASAPLPIAVSNLFYKKTGIEITQRYGTTESLVITSNNLSSPVRGTVGHPIPTMQMRINSNDEVEIKGPSLFLGYWGDYPTSHLTTDGWFCTGDQGYVDSTGGLVLTGRSKDIIISGGYKISPIEVETVIDSCLGVKESVVIGLQDSDLGERPVAFIVGESIDYLQLSELCKKQLSKFKRPIKIFLAHSLPKNDLGKIQKNVLRYELANNISDRVIRSI